MKRMTNMATCGDAPACDPVCGIGIERSGARARPDRAALLVLVAQNGRRVKDLAICQADCAHCYAGHCGTSTSGESGRRN